MSGWLIAAIVLGTLGVVAVVLGLALLSYGYRLARRDAALAATLGASEWRHYLPTLWGWGLAFLAGSLFWTVPAAILAIVHFAVGG